MTNSNENLILSLKLAGLNENESKIYLTILEYGPISVSILSQKTNIKRPTCYASLENLINDKIATKIEEKTKAIFDVIEPKKLLMMLEKRKNVFRDSLSMFNALQKKIIEKPQVTVYEGMEGIRQALKLSLEQNENSQILVMGTAKFWAEQNDYNRYYMAERVSQNINLKGMFVESNNNYLFLRTDREELRESHFVAREHFDPMIETQVFGSTVIYIDLSGSVPFATVLESESIAHDERQRFEILWHVSK